MGVGALSFPSGSCANRGNSTPSSSVSWSMVLFDLNFVEVPIQELLTMFRYNYFVTEDA